MKPGSPEYKEATANMITASGFAAACGLNPYCSRQEYWEQKVNGKIVLVNTNIQRGIDHEKDAIDAYEAITGSLTGSGGFWINTRYPHLGASPDATVGGSGLLEAKCPESVYNDIPVYYLTQMVGQCVMSNREWCDFIAWTPTNVAIWRMNGSAKAWEWMYPRLTEMLKNIKEKKKPERFKNGQKPDPAEFRKLCDYKRIYG